MISPLRRNQYFLDLGFGRPVVYSRLLHFLKLLNCGAHQVSYSSPHLCMLMLSLFQIDGIVQACYNKACKC